MLDPKGLLISEMSYLLENYFSSPQSCYIHSGYEASARPPTFSEDDDEQKMNLEITPSFSNVYAMCDLSVVLNGYT